MAARTSPTNTTIPDASEINHFTGVQLLVKTSVTGIPTGTATTDTLTVGADNAIWDTTTNQYVRIDQTNSFGVNQ